MTRRIVIHNEFARALDDRGAAPRVTVGSLRTGDVISSGEKVTKIARTNDGLVEVLLGKNGSATRLVRWAADAKISVHRARDTEFSPNARVTYQKNKRERGAAVVLSKSKKPNHYYIKTSTGETLLVPEGELEKGSADGVGTPEEVAYGEGWHSSENVNPYTSTAERAAWERGRAAKKQKYRMNQHTALQGPRGSGMKRKVSFEPPSRSGGPVNPGHIADVQSPLSQSESKALGNYLREKGYTEAQVRSHIQGLLTKQQQLPYASEIWNSYRGYTGGKYHPEIKGKDFKSEKGYVAKLLDAQTGAVLARSEPYISNGPSLKKWIQEQATDLIRKGKRVKAEVNVAFFDPNMAS